VGACVPTDKVIQEVVRERGRGAAVGAAGDVAPAIVTAGVDLSRLVGAGGTAGVQAGQLVRLAVAVEVLLLGAIGFYSQLSCVWP
jgi:enolase